MPKIQNNKNEIIAREWIHCFMLALGNLIITRVRNKIIYLAVHEYLIYRNIYIRAGQTECCYDRLFNYYLCAIDVKKNKISKTFLMVLRG